jgi:hypothetical protein
MTVRLLEMWADPNQADVNIYLATRVYQGVNIHVIAIIRGTWRHTQIRNLPIRPRWIKIYPSSIYKSAIKIMQYFISRKISFLSEGYIRICSKICIRNFPMFTWRPPQCRTIFCLFLFLFLKPVSESISLGVRG